jgi:membrane peptidoglycan carboxypeptidase
VTLAAALEEKITRPDEVIDCQMGSIEVANRTIHDHKAYGELTVAQVLSNSSDVGAIKLGLRLGDERFDHYIRSFGFGRQTGIELPGETRGIAKPVSRWSKVSIGAISMGQEIGVSALQLASMMSTIANDGVYNAPRLVAGSLEGAPETGLRNVMFHPADQHRVISTLTAAEMKTMLEGVVLNGTGKRAILDGYTSAGKTGTAQKADPRTGGYSRSQYIASFAGFAPVNNPAVTVLVVLDSPKGGHEGGAVAAPVFARVTQQVLAYLNVPHDASLADRRHMLLRAAAAVPESEVADGAEDRFGDTPDAPEPTTDTASAPQAPTLQNTGLASLKPAPPREQQTTPAQQAGPTAPRVAARGTTVIDVEGEVVVPSLIGMPLRAALETASASHLELEVVGSGVARAQDPPAGSHVTPGGVVSVRFAR